MADPADNELQPGSVLGNYVLEELVGGGAMGVVWKGSDRRDGSRVAIKILNQKFSRDPTFRQRFEREAHVATLLKSPYTVQTFAFGREHGQYYLVMEFVEGDSVEKKLARGPLPLDDALEIATDAARALEAAASHKIVHRDLKPSNIIVSPDGAAKLVDFGIAGQANVQDSGGAFIGTVQYAPPEQQGGQVDERTDIYALGATLFHMLAGRPPYTGRTNDDILSQHKMAPFPAPLLALQPEAVVDVIRRCMQKDPEDRYSSAAELAAAIDRVRMRIIQVRAQTAPILPDDLRTLVPEPEPADASGDTLLIPGKPSTPAASIPGGETVIHAPSASQAPAPAPAAPPAPRPIPPAPVAVAAAPAPAPVSAPAAPVGAPPASGGKKGKGMLFAVIGGAVIIAGIAAGAVFALGGGGGDDDGGLVPASGSPSPAASPTPAASPSATGTSDGTTSAGTGTATAVTPTAEATTPAAATATPTPVPPTATPTTAAPATATPVPATPTPTRPPAAASYSVSVGGGCSGISTVVSYSNLSSSVSVTASYSGGSTALLPASATISPPGGEIAFSTPAVGPGTYTVSVTAGGAFVGSGSATC